MFRKLRKGVLVYVIIVMLSFLSIQMAQGQEFPTKTVIMYYGSSPGGSHDLTFRAVTSVAFDCLGQAIVIRGKPGAGGVIATEIVAKAAPDGYTLLIGGPGWNTFLPAIEGRGRGPGQMEAVCRINYSPVIIITRPDMPYKTFKEMVAWAKAHPGDMIFGNTGPWSQADLCWKRIMRHTGIKTQEVPYPGGGAALLAILGKHIEVTAGLPTTYLGHFKAGRLRPLVILDDKRHPALPDVPTGKELGLNMVANHWRGVMAPKGTPRPIVDKLALAFKKMTEEKGVKKMIKRFGDKIQYLGPDEFTKFWQEEYEAIQELGLKKQQ